SLFFGHMMCHDQYPLRRKSLNLVGAGSLPGNRFTLYCPFVTKSFMSAMNAGGEVKTRNQEQCCVRDGRRYHNHFDTCFPYLKCAALWRCFSGDLRFHKVPAQLACELRIRCAITMAATRIMR